MTTFRVLAGDELDVHLDAISVLMAESYPSGSARMDAAYLRWALGGPPGVAMPPFGVAGFDDMQRLVAFSGVTTRRVVAGTTPTDVYLKSFMAVHPDHQGGGLTVPLYRRRQQEFLAQGGMHHCRLIYAREGSVGAQLLEKDGAAGKWIVHKHTPMHTWGLLRGRHRTPASPAVIDLRDVLALDSSDSTVTWLAADPRLVDVSPQGIRIVLVHSNARDTPPVAAIEGIPAIFSTDILIEAVEQAERILPANVRQIVVSGTVAAMDPALSAVGFRRVPGPAWLSWITARQAIDPALQAATNLVPIT